MFKLQDIVRPNIWNLTPYSCARSEFSGRNASVFLDANENPYNEPYNRYPDPLQKELKQQLSVVKGVRPEQMCLGNGSDETIDLVYRCFCEPRQDNVVAIEPTYGMYRVCADVNDVEYRPVLLNDDFQMDADKVLKACDTRTKVIWICSPNNPTGNSISHEEIVKVLNAFHGIVVVDEAYSDFSNQRPFREDLDQCPNLIVLNTFSKAFGCAALRLGMAFASTGIIGIFNKVKYPYNVNLLTQEKAQEVLKDRTAIHKRVMMILDERERVMASFAQLPICEKVYPTDANFFLAKMTDANAIYQELVTKGIIVRNRNKVALCGNCLRITIGSKTENMALLSALRTYRP